MPDSPKCISCLQSGRIGQTYKVAGRSLYRCSDCKVVYRASDFEPIEFAWKDDFDGYKRFAKSRGFEIKDMYLGNR